MNTKSILLLITVSLGFGEIFSAPAPSLSSAAKPGLRDEPLQCYNCSCTGTSCPCTTYEISAKDNTYCVILRETFGQSATINLQHIDASATAVYIREFPYVLVEESISYNETNSRWSTRTNFVLYGCNWNLCNKPELVGLLPDSFQMRLPDAWLNSNVLGDGRPVRDCHECPETPQCGTTDFLDASRCPIRACNTTCVVSDSFNDPAFDLQCYQSYCIPPEDDVFSDNRHRVEIEGLIYGNNPSVVEFWEIDIFCRANDCSRAEVFKELREQLTVQPGNLQQLFSELHDPSIPQRRCYDCYCYDGLSNCACNKTNIRSANSTYCTIILLTDGQDVWVDFEHIDQGSTRVYIREFPYLLVEESILYDERSGRWNTLTNLVIFGCNWDYCNDPRYLSSLPNGFQMRLPETWLNTSVLGTGQPARNCHQCPDAAQCGSTSFLDASRCPISSCNTTCIVSDTFDDPAKDEQCYQSYCAYPDTPDYQVDTHRVEIEGILYLNKPSRDVELWEIDIFCRADDCSRPAIFNEVSHGMT